VTASVHSTMVDPDCEGFRAIAAHNRALPPLKRLTDDKDEAKSAKK